MLTGSCKMNLHLKIYNYNILTAVKFAMHAILENPNCIFANLSIYLTQYDSAKLSEIPIAGTAV